ncbi:DJ-1/PfpI family protein [Piscinibacter sakaiensis]|uniref:Transcriptional regulator, AraC family n=1 Tax=Piscinibacter sakaiensis TaxID=1547922 RepID=A0A0K8P3G4_PISS1|nr:DJ-1/PfpI family protein [Piscinibacter sakaiensis]GAP36745.1 transcriptional regulator, AraC family [Piscinibacter sakaiensis]
MKFAFLLYPGVEPIDLAALGVVSMGRRLMPALSYLTVAAAPGLQTLANGLRVAADTGFDDCPPVDWLIVPGGPGWSAAAEDPALLDFLRARAATPMVSLCTGAMILAAAGLLDGRVATTKCQVTAAEDSPLDLLAERHPRVEARPALLVDEGQLITGGGVGLCIDTLLYLLATRVDAAKTEELARILEYGAAAQANRARLDTVVRSGAAAGG